MPKPTPFPAIQAGAYLTLYSDSSPNIVIVRIVSNNGDGTCAVMRLERATPSMLHVGLQVLDKDAKFREFRFRKAEIATPVQVVAYMTKMQQEIASALTDLAVANARYAAEFAQVARGFAETPTRPAQAA